MPGVGRGMMRRTPGPALVQVIAIMWGGLWVQRSAVRTRRRDADVHGHHGVIIRLRHVTPSRSARDRRSSSRITTKMPTLSQIPFVVSLSNHGRYRRRPPTSFDRFRDHYKDANAFPDTVRGEPVEPWTVPAPAAHILRQVQGERPSYRQGRQRECCRRSSASAASKHGLR